MLDQFTLGCAQIGQPYGFRRSALGIRSEDPERLLEHAIDLGITHFDTAQAYGESEEILGRVLKRHKNKNFHVTTKLLPTLNPNDIAGIFNHIQSSIKKIGKPIDSLLLHNPLHSHYFCTFASLIYESKSQVKGLGTSVYTPSEAIVILRGYDPLYGKELSLFEYNIQAPYNIMNHEPWDQSGILEAYKNSDIITLRSIFMQGILSMTPDEAIKSSYDVRSRFVMDQYHHAIREAYPDGNMNTLPKLVALSFVRLAQPTARLVIGADNCAELTNLVEMLQAPPLPVKLDLKKLTQVAWEQRIT